MQKDFKRPLRPQQQSAYDGAKFFFKYFISLAMIYGIFAFFYFQKDYTKIQISSYIHILIMIMSYGFSLKYYSICNKIGNQPYQIRTKSFLSQEFNQQEIQYQFENKSEKFDKVQILDEEPSTDRQINFKLSDIKPVSPSSTKHQNQNSILINDQQHEPKFRKYSDEEISIRPKKFYCKICQFQCPYRTRHCLKCNTCVLRYDHHCFWIGNCVGIRNHFYFYVFLFLQSVNNYQTTRLCKDIIYLQNLQYNLVWCSFIALFLMGLSFLLFTGYLFLYHTILGFTGMTTWEHMRKQKISYMRHLKKGYQPFSNGACKNFKDFIKKQWVDQNLYGRNGRQWIIPSFQQAKVLEGGNLIQNKYYSCC